MASSLVYQPAQSAHGPAEFLVDKEAHFTNNGNIFVGSQTFQAGNINLGPKKDAEEDECKCVRDLYSVDRDAFILKEKQRDRLVEESFAWIFENKSFKLWLQDEQQERERQEAPEIPSTMGSSSETAQPETLLPNTRPQILCITAGPGMGKTMTMIGIINELSKTKGPVMSYYICQGTDDRLSSPAAAAKELLYQILSQPKNKGLVKYLQEPYRKSGGKILEGDSENVFLILQNVLMQLIRDDHLPEVYFFIDALDECKEPKYLLQMIKKTTFVSRKIRWLISHRNNLQVDIFLADLEEDKVHSIIDFAAHGPEVNEGVARYISGKVASFSHSRFTLDQKRRLSEVLLEKAQGTYLWINFACEALEEGSISGVDRLEHIPPGLAAIYDKALGGLRTNRFMHKDILFSILGTMVVAFRPLVLAEFVALLEHTSDSTGSIARVTKRELDINTVRSYVRCNPFLMFQGDVICFVHYSAKEYLEQNSSVFQIISPTESDSGKWFHHRNMYINCRRQIKDKINLEKMIGVATDAALADVSAIRQLDYACCHWANHLKGYVTMRWAPHNIPMAEESKEFQEEILQFFQRDLLNWLMALGILQKITNGIIQLDNLRTIFGNIKRRDGTDSNASGMQSNLYRTLLETILDAQLFISYNQSLFEDTPTQIYSAVLFSPAKSAIRRYFSWTIPPWIKTKPLVDEDWGRCFRIIENSVSSAAMALSSSNRYIAAGYKGGYVQVWDIVSGAQILEPYSMDPLNLPPEIFQNSGEIRSREVAVDSIRFAKNDEKLMVTLRGTLKGSPSPRRGITLRVLDLASEAWETPINIMFTGGDLVDLQLLKTTGRLIFAPNGQYCVGFYKRLVVYLETDDKFHSYNTTCNVEEISSEHSNSILSLVVSPDSERFATVTFTEVSIWTTKQPITKLYTIDIPSEKLQEKELEVLQAPIVCFSHDHQFIAIVYGIVPDWIRYETGTTPKLGVWKLSTRERTNFVKIPFQPRQLFFSSDLKSIPFIYANSGIFGLNLDIYIFHIDRDSKPLRLRYQRCVGGIETHVSLCSGWALASSPANSEDPRIRDWFIWDLVTDDLIQLKLPSDAFTTLKGATMSPDRTTVAISSDRCAASLLLFDLKKYSNSSVSPPRPIQAQRSLSSLLRLPAMWGARHSNEISPTFAISKLCAFTEARAQAEGETRGQVFKGMRNDCIPKLAIPVRGRAATHIDAGKLYIWDTQDQILQQILPVKTMGRVSSIQFSSNGYMVAYAAYTVFPRKMNTIEVYDLSDGLLPRRIASHELDEDFNNVTAIAFSPDSSVVAYSNNEKAGHIDLKTGFSHSRSHRETSKVKFNYLYNSGAATFSEDGRLVTFYHSKLFDTDITAYWSLYDLQTKQLTRINLDLNLAKKELASNQSPLLLQQLQNETYLIVGNLQFLVNQQKGVAERVQLENDEVLRPKYAQLYIRDGWLYFGAHRIVWIPDTYGYNDYKCGSDGTIVVSYSGRTYGFYTLGLDLKVLAEELTRS
ncbi:hypothetical protein AOL_s00215g15 [Orbilia oligospora ATCC 24927]|uniref:Nephrocystin 3-like N-terminal domain-containing protein n=1 Tax=Arthrobotrys oligospora (strain ATCC 24927 / CBS 115.81 / DSM 1491) TaxID=756982 RepID=G1XT86_ARTOA|nr:hypothetical protein AOL_s00215g15 [Orbilia oligospora ATCC 24927]EGX43279.1 hypothetical protein AOL_s00215g15 [Orbilia oligospora ATCC 24927]